MTSRQALEHLDLADVIRVMEDDPRDQVGVCGPGVRSGAIIQP